MNFKNHFSFFGRKFYKKFKGQLYFIEYLRVSDHNRIHLL